MLLIRTVPATRMYTVANSFPPFVIAMNFIVIKKEMRMEYNPVRFSSLTKNLRTMSP